MTKSWGLVVAALLVCCGALMSARAVEVPQAEWEAMKQKIADLSARTDIVPVTSTMVDTAMDNKYSMTTPTTALRAPGKVEIGLLMQYWYYDIARDNRGIFSDPNNNGIVDNNNSNDINSFRVRRTELTVAYHLNECFGSVLMFDPAREANGFPTFPFPQGNTKKTGVGTGQFTAGTSTTITGGLISGNQGAAAAGSPPRLLQNAYETMENVVPYFDFKVGQFKNKCGEEGVRDSGLLDFAERSMIGFQGDNRDLGAAAHGSFWGKDCHDQDGRFQIWGGIMDGSGSFYNPGNEQGRSDNNQSKDFNCAFLVRPVWQECAGKLELGASYAGGKHGAQSTDLTSYTVAAGTPVAKQLYASKGNVWFSYFFGDWFAKGLWVRGEYGFIRDRQEGSVVAFGNGNGAGGLSQTALNPFTSQGGYLAAGYRFGECSWKDCCPCWLKGFELCGRYDKFQNIDITNLANPNFTQALYTTCTTAGVNYYITDRTKVQVNYNFVQLPGDKTNSARSFHDTQSNSLLINFQVSY